MNSRFAQRLKRLEDRDEDDEELDLIIEFVEPGGAVTGRYRLTEGGLSPVEENEEVRDDQAA